MSRFDRDVLKITTGIARRLGSDLSSARTASPLFFGRLDFGDGAEPVHHVGRRHVTDDAGEPMVLDWRAPLSRLFYRASARDPDRPFCLSAWTTAP